MEDLRDFRTEQGKIYNYKVAVAHVNSLGQKDRFARMVISHNSRLDRGYSPRCRVAAQKGRRARQLPGERVIFILKIIECVKI